MQTYTFGPFTIHYMERDEWDLIGRQNGAYLGPRPFHALVPHHTVTGFVRAYRELVIDRMRYLQRLRPDLGTDIPYNFVIFAGANEYEAYVAEGRGIGWSGAHTYGFNSEVHAASFWGNSVTDPVDPAIFEAIRFVGRMMLDAGCPVTTPTIDHGQWPDQGTACAGTKIRAGLAEVQPPFKTPGTVANPTPIKKKVTEVYSFHKRDGVFAWSGYPQAVAYDSAVVDTGDEITVSLKGNSGTRNVTLIESNGAQTTKAVQWGMPASFVVQNSGWTSVVVGADGADAIRVEGRG